MLRLKSALYNISVEDLIREAVKSYQKEIPLLESCLLPGDFCDGGMEVIELPYSVPFKIGSHVQEIVVTDVPAYRCTKCGDIQRDVELVATIEEVFNQEMEERLGSHEPLPSSISLHDLM
ncbi:hypothetical protein EMIT07CA2_550097 [Brevibacillus sp. IT-7CA2]|uniref:hypothetical protein n=1 Tax=Brevibacillus sp. IT-7CA2 TaxID=3026436 RepID=UPI0039DF96F1